MGMGLNQKSINLKIIHVKDTDRLNQAGSEIDSEVNILHIFEPFRSLSPTSTGLSPGLFYFFLIEKNFSNTMVHFYKLFDPKNIF